MFMTAARHLTRDVIASLRPKASQLNCATRQLITHLGCGPKSGTYRGCRAGRRVQQRRLAASQAFQRDYWLGPPTQQAIAKPIPVITGHRPQPIHRCTQPPRYATVVDVVKRSPATPGRVVDTAVPDTPTLYVLNVAAVTKPHAVQHLAADLTGYQVHIAVIT